MPEAGHSRQTEHAEDPERMRFDYAEDQNRRARRESAQQEQRIPEDFPRFPGETPPRERQENQVQPGERGVEQEVGLRDP